MSRIQKQSIKGSEEKWKDSKTGHSARVVLEHPDEPYVVEIRFGDRCEMGITEQVAEEVFLIWCDSGRRTRIVD